MTTTQKAPNGILFLKYRLKNEMVFTCNIDNDDARTDRIFTQTMPAGTMVQINLSATLSGNYAEFVYRNEKRGMTFRYNLEKEYADKLVEKYKNEKFL